MQRRRRNKKKIVLGITGSFGSGKTTVAKMFARCGAEVIDADSLAHGCISRGKPAYKKICKVFGSSILDTAKEVDRRKLAEIVFDKKSQLYKLNRIVHPEVIRQIRERIKDSSSSVVVVDAPLLIESGLYKKVDMVIVVTLDRARQAARLKAKNALLARQLAKRIRQQMPLRSKVRFADFVIDNNGSIRQTEKQVESLRRIVWKS